MKHSFIYVISFIALEGLLQGCGSPISGNSSQAAASTSTPNIVVTFTQATKPAQPVLTFTTVPPTAAPTATAVPPTATTRPAATATPLHNPIPVTPTVAASATSAVPAVAYACDVGKSFNAIFDKNKAIVQLPDKTAELFKQPSESGILFSGGNLTLLTQGSDAFIEENGKMVYYNCRARQGNAVAIQASAAAVANAAAPVAVAPAATATSGAALVPAVVLPASTAPAIATPAPTPPPAQIAIGTPSAQSFFGCDGNKNFRVAYYPAGVLLDLGDFSAQLRPQQSLSGKIWGDGEWTLLIQGSLVFVEQNGVMVRTNCRLR